MRGFIHKEGYLIIPAILVILAGINLPFIIFFPPAVKYSFMGISAVFFVLVLNFFRNPVRMGPAQENSIISPADGRVVVIEETLEKEYFKDRRIQVSIFMSPLDVHVNRFPIGGLVKYVQYHPGKYLVAWHPKSSEENERNTVVIEGRGVEVLIRQIAGAVARRISCYVSQGRQAVQGGEFGFIRFGSRVDVFLPLHAKISVSLGKKVKGGVSVLASL